MSPDEIKRAREMYEAGEVLAEVRVRLRAEGFPSRSVNTIATRLRQDGCQLRPSGRRRGR